METASTASKKIEEIQKVIQQLIESKQASASASASATATSISENHLLCNLLSQLESLKQDEVAVQSEAPAEAKDGFAGTSEVEHTSKDEAAKPERSAGVSADIVKELKKVEKQNKTTHWLLSALIILTLAWQVSEFSILLKLKQGLNHPLRSVGSMVAGMVKRRKQKEEETEQSSLLEKVNGSENPLKISNMDLSGFINGEEE